MTELNPETFQVVDTAAAEAQRTEQLAAAVEDAQRQMTVQQPAPPRQEAAPQWSADDWRRESMRYHGNFGAQPEKPKPSDPMEAINKKLEHLAAMVEEYRKPQEPQSFGYRAAADPELASADPGLANRFENLSTTFEQALAKQKEEYEKQLTEIKKTQAERDKAIEAERYAVYQSKWETELRRIVPDIEAFLPGTPGGQALFAWAQAIPEYVDAVAGNPYRYSPHFVSQIINQFKASNATPPAKTPTLADLAAPVLGGQAPAAVQASVPDGPLLSEAQMATAWDEANQLYAQGYDKKGDALIAAYERTLKYKKG